MSNLIPLVTVENGSPVTTSLAISDGTGNDHSAVIKLVRRYQEDLEVFGQVRFEIRLNPQGSPTEYATLNERQATLIISYMRNSEVVRAFKMRLVKRFYEMAEQLQSGNRESARPQSALLDAVHALAVLRSEVERVPGVRVEIAAAQYLSAVSANTGLNTEPLRKALPSTIKPQPSLNATAVGKLVGCSAAEANRRLEAAGLQRRDARGEWALTPAGTQYGAALPYANGKHSGYQVLWLESVARLIQSKAA